MSEGKLRDRINEFELDWAQAPIRSERIDAGKLRGRKIGISGSWEELVRALSWSFEAWEETGVSLSVHTGEAEDCDDLILTGFCCRNLPSSAAKRTEALKAWQSTLEKAFRSAGHRVLLLSDGRVYGRAEDSFALSEYEKGSFPGGNSEEAYFLQIVESMFLAAAEKAGKAYQILRMGELYGPCLGGLETAQTLMRIAGLTAAKTEASLCLSSRTGSYLCIHDALTAVHYVLTECPDNKIFNVSGKESDASAGDLVMLLYRNFPDQCRISLTWKAADGEDLSSPALLDTRLFQRYGFAPAITLEDGLIMLVKSMQPTGEVFIFDHTYMGKLDTVHQILLGYLLEIDRICEKYGIRYFLAGGTLLGAIRHQGFIPWDDDADVMMLREDFDRFMEVARDELPGNIFIQTSRTERLNHNAFVKLRIDDTLFATEFTGRFLSMHNGIFFDILAHDRTGNHKWSQKLHLMGTMLSRSIVFNKWGNTRIKSGGAHPVLCRLVDFGKYLIPMPFAEWVQERMYRLFEKKETDYLYDGMGRNLKRGSFPRKWLEESIRVPFEGYLLPVPKEYDRYLTWLYGDYMQMVPVSARRTSHSIVLSDLGAYSGYRCPAPPENVREKKPEKSSGEKRK